MAAHRKVIAALIACMILLSGCSPDVQQLQQQNAQQQQQIAQLSEELAQAKAGAIEQDQAETEMADAQLAYQWAGPLRWLPLWPAGIDQTTRHAPDWKGYLLLGAVWSALLIVVAVTATAAWLAVWLSGLVIRKSGLERTIKQLEAKAQPLRDLQKSLRDARSEIERISHEKSKAQAGLDEIERAVTGRRQDLAELQTQCADLRKESDQLRADLETLRGFS